jgi:hypothetical protein
MGLFGKSRDRRLQLDPRIAELMRYREEGQRLLTTGMEEPAVITSVTPLDSLPSGAIMTAFGVTIAPADGEPYPVTIRQAMSLRALAGLSVGEVVTVRCDAADRMSAMIVGW